MRKKKKRTGREKRIVMGKGLVGQKKIENKIEKKRGKKIARER